MTQRLKLSEMRYKNRLHSTSLRNLVFFFIKYISMQFRNVLLFSVADISSTLGDGIKEIRKQMAVEKPLFEGALTYFPGGSGEADGGQVFHVQLFGKKRTMEFFASMATAKDGTESPSIEFYFEVQCKYA